MGAKAVSGRPTEALVQANANWRASWGRTSACPGSGRLARGAMSPPSHEPVRSKPCGCGGGDVLVMRFLGELSRPRCRPGCRRHSPGHEPPPGFTIRSWPEAFAPGVPRRCHQPALGDRGYDLLSRVQRRFLSRPWRYAQGGVVAEMGHAEASPGWGIGPHLAGSRKRPPMHEVVVLSGRGHGQDLPTAASPTGPRTVICDPG